MKKYWTTSDLRWIENNITLSDAKMALHFGVTKKAVASTRKRYGIRKLDDGTFKKGDKPCNVGMNFNAGGKSIETQYRKGNSPHNEKHDGAITTRADKSGRKYQYIRIEKGKWRLLSRVVWEAFYSEKLSINDVIIFIDGNPMNCEITNLKKISRAENMVRNQNRQKAAQSNKRRWKIRKIYADYGLNK